jgi:hypothetical protein
MLEALNNIGGFLGGVGVIVTLLYLAKQIRENSRATRVAAMQSAMMAGQQLAMLPAQDVAVARVLRIGLIEPARLDENEFQQFRYLLMGMLRVAEDLFVQHAAGVIDDETWAARARSYRTLFSLPGGRQIWNSSDAYRDDFQAWMNAYLDRTGS